MKSFVNKCFLICSTTLLICFTLACPQSYPRGRRFNQDYNQDYDDWEFAQNSRNDNRGINRLNNNPMGNRGGLMNGFDPYDIPSMHQLEDRSYDLAYGLGQGYGKKLGDGIKSGIGKSLSVGLDKGRRNGGKESEDKQSDEDNKKKREDP